MDRAVTRNARVRTTDRARIPANVSVLEDGTETCVKSPAPTVSSAKTAPSLALHASSVLFHSLLNDSLTSPSSFS